MSQEVDFPEPGVLEEIVEPELIAKFARQVEEKSFVIVHLVFAAGLDWYAVRVWPTTYLISGTTQHRSRLMHVENISLAPQWTQVPAGKRHSCSLYFEGLPKNVTIFDLAEIIPEPGGFLFKNIMRNKSDVYMIEA
jgi:hypothetical protein